MAGNHDESVGLERTRFAVDELHRKEGIIQCLGMTLVISTLGVGAGEKLFHSTSPLMAPGKLVSAHSHTGVAPRTRRGTQRFPLNKVLTALAVNVSLRLSAVGPAQDARPLRLHVICQSAGWGIVYKVDLSFIDTRGVCSGSPVPGERTKWFLVTRRSFPNRVHWLFIHSLLVYVYFSVNA